MLEGSGLQVSGLIHIFVVLCDVVVVVTRLKATIEKGTCSSPQKHIIVNQHFAIY